MRLLVVEDQIRVSNFLFKGLREMGYSVDLASSINAADEMVFVSDYDLVILDVMLPDGSGIEFATKIKKHDFKGAILILSALSSTQDKIKGLDAGADDYLTKPFSIEELQARVRALLRRNSDIKTVNLLKYRDLQLNIISRQVTRNNFEIELTAKEFSLLEYFLRNPEKPLTRSMIAEHVWDVSFDSESNVIDVYINLIRKKLETGGHTRLIHTLVGVGYVLKEKSIEKNNLVL